MNATYTHACSTKSLGSTRRGRFDKVQQGELLRSLFVGFFTCYKSTNSSTNHYQVIIIFVIKCIHIAHFFFHLLNFGLGGNRLRQLLLREQEGAAEARFN